MTFDYRSHAIPGRWRHQAACKGRDHEMAIPPTPKSGAWTVVQFEHIETAVNICHGCLVQAPCLEWALTHPDPAQGMVAGGYTPKQRDAIRKGLPAPPLRRNGRPRKGAA